MSFQGNNYLIHNLRSIAEQAQSGVLPEVGEREMAKLRLMAPAALFKVLADPAVLASLSTKAYGHKATKATIGRSQSAGRQIEEQLLTVKRRLAASALQALTADKA